MLALFKNIKGKIEHFSRDSEIVIKDSSFEKESNKNFKTEKRSS